MEGRPFLAAVVGAATAVLVTAGVVVLADGSSLDQGRPSAGRVVLDARLQSFRAREADRVALLVLQNKGEEPVTVRRVRLDAPDLQRLAALDVEAVVRPGARVDVPIPYGPARCRHGGGGEAGRHATAWVLVGGRDTEASDGAHKASDGAHEVRLDLPDPEPLVRKVVRLDCQRRTLEAAVDVRLGPKLVPAGPQTWFGEVVARRRGSSAPVEIVALDGSVVFTIGARRHRAGPLLRLDAGEVEAALPVRVGLPSCSPHTLIEAKKAFVFPMRVRLGDGPDLVASLPVDDPARDALMRIIRETCA